MRRFRRSASRSVVRRRPDSLASVVRVTGCKDPTSERKAPVPPRRRSRRRPARRWLLGRKPFRAVLGAARVILKVLPSWRWTTVAFRPPPAQARSRSSRTRLNPRHYRRSCGFPALTGYGGRVKRHAALVPLAHDHHHALVEARRLSRGAAEDEVDRVDAAERFLAFYAADTIEHFREEEERLFPLLVDQGDAANELLVRALLDHQRIHALVQRLREGVAATSADAATMRELGELLHGHIRLEERELFPFIEAAVSEQELGEIAIEPRDPSAERQVVDLIGPSGTGPLWGTQTEDLNVTLLAWPARGGPGGEHRNSERDVLLVVLEGQATVMLEGDEHLVRAGQALVVEKGRTRKISAGADGVRYLSIHLRRRPLEIGRAAPAKP